MQRPFTQEEKNKYKAIAVGVLQKIQKRNAPENDTKLAKSILNGTYKSKSNQNGLSR